MKKLIIAAVIVCAAAFAQASTFVWGINGYNLKDGASGSMTPDKLAMDGTLMLFMGEVVQTANGGGTYTLNFDNATFITQGTINGTTYKYGNFNTSSAGRSSSDLVTSTVVGTEFTLLLLESNTTDYENYEGKYYMVHTTTQSEGYDSQTTEKYGQFTSTAAATGTSWNTAGAVPEPTSGLLLLIGVASLALRRRRA